MNDSKAPNQCSRPMSNVNITTDPQSTPDTSITAASYSGTSSSLSEPSSYSSTSITAASYSDTSITAASYCVTSSLSKPSSNSGTSITAASYSDTSITAASYCVACSLSTPSSNSGTSCLDSSTTYTLAVSKNMDDMEISNTQNTTNVSNVSLKSQTNAGNERKSPRQTTQQQQHLTQNYSVVLGDTNHSSNKLHETEASISPVPISEMTHDTNLENLHTALLRQNSPRVGRPRAPDVTPAVALPPPIIHSIKVPNKSQDKEKRTFVSHREIHNSEVEALQSNKDSCGQSKDVNGQSVDTHGQSIESSGHIIDAHGQTIGSSGRDKVANGQSKDPQGGFLTVDMNSSTRPNSNKPISSNQYARNTMETESIDARQIQTDKIHRTVSMAPPKPSLSQQSSASTIETLPTETTQIKSRNSPIRAHGLKHKKTSISNNKTSSMHTSIASKDRVSSPNKQKPSMHQTLVTNSKTSIPSGSDPTKKPFIHNNVQYRPPALRKNAAKLVGPKGASVAQPNYDDTLRRVSVVIYQHILRGEMSLHGTAPMDSSPMIRGLADNSTPESPLGINRNASAVSQSISHRSTFGKHDTNDSNQHTSDKTRPVEYFPPKLVLDTQKKKLQTPNSYLDKTKQKKRNSTSMTYVSPNERNNLNHTTSRQSTTRGMLDTLQSNSRQMVSNRESNSVDTRQQSNSRPLADPNSRHMADTSRPLADMRQSNSRRMTNSSQSKSRPNFNESSHFSNNRSPTSQDADTSSIDPSPTSNHHQQLSPIYDSTTDISEQDNTFYTDEDDTESDSDTPKTPIASQFQMTPTKESPTKQPKTLYNTPSFLHLDQTDPETLNTNQSNKHNLTLSKRLKNARARQSSRTKFQLIQQATQHKSHSSKKSMRISDNNTWNRSNSIKSAVIQTREIGSNRPYTPPNVYVSNTLNSNGTMNDTKDIFRERNISPLSIDSESHEQFIALQPNNQSNTFWRRTKSMIRHLLSWGQRNLSLIKHTMDTQPRKEEIESNFDITDPWCDIDEALDFLADHDGYPYFAAHSNTDTYISINRMFDEANFIVPEIVVVSSTAIAIPRMLTTLAMKRPHMYVTPTVQDIYEFAKNLFCKIDLSAECSVICLIYIERFMTCTNIKLLTTNWRPLVLCGLLMASKVWQDAGSWNIEFAQAYPEFSLKAINRLERLFTGYIDYRLYVSSREYATYYFGLRSLSEKKNFRRRFVNVIAARARAVATAQAQEIPQDFDASLYSRSL